MKECPPTVGGWTWYCIIVKESITVTDEQIKLLMKMYINGVPVEKAIEDMKNVSN